MNKPINWLVILLAAVLFTACDPDDENFSPPSVSVNIDELDYVVVSHDRKLEFMAEIDRRMKDGWAPQGGVAFQVRDIGVVFAQAMTRKDKANGD